MQIRWPDLWRHQCAVGNQRHCHGLRSVPQGLLLAFHFSHPTSQIVCSIYASFRFANAAVANSAPVRSNTNANTNTSTTSELTVSSMSMNTQTMNERRAAHMKAVKSFMFYPLVCVICWYTVCLCWCLLCVRLPLMGWFLNLYYQGDAAFILVYLNGHPFASAQLNMCSTGFLNAILFFWRQGSRRCADCRGLERSHSEEESTVRRPRSTCVVVFCCVCVHLCCRVPDVRRRLACFSQR